MRSPHAELGDSKPYWDTSDCQLKIVQLVKYPRSCYVGRMAELPQLTKDLAQKFFAVLIRHRAYIQGRVMELGLSPPHVFVIHMLADGPLTMRELSQKSVLEPSHLTGIVDRLEERKLVSRKIDPKDRRIKLVSLTRSGKALRDKLMMRLGSPVPWMLALSQDDQAALLSILERVLAQTDSDS